MAVVGAPAVSAATPEVTGRLVSDSGAALAGLQVRAVPAAGYGSVGSSKAVTTDAQGNFRLPMPRAGTRFLLEAFDPARTSGAGAYGECREPARTRALTTFIGSRGKQTFTHVDPITGYKVREGSSISTGTHKLAASGGFDIDVVDDPAVSQSWVSIERRDGEEAASEDCGDLDHGFAPGAYVVVVRATGYPDARVPTTLGRGEVERHVVRLTKPTSPTPGADAGAVRGRFVRPGKSSSGIVELRTSDGVVVAKKKLKNRAVFTLEAPAGRYALVYRDTRSHVFSYSTVRVQARQTTQLGNVRVTRKAVKLYGDVPRGVKMTATVVSGKTTATTTVVGGRYRLEDLIPGTYRIEFRRPGYFSKTVTVKVRSTTRLTPPTLAKIGGVRGTVVYAANGKHVSRDAQVQAALTSRRTGDVGWRDPSDLDATLKLRPWSHLSVPRGRYAVELRAPSRSETCGGEHAEDPCYAAAGINAWRTPYFWEGREVIKLSSSTTSVGKIAVRISDGVR